MNTTCTGRPNDVRGLTECRQCGGDCEIVAHDDEKPVDRMVFSCSDCSHEESVGVLWYPDGSYEAIAPTLDSDGDCDVYGCSSAADVRFQRSSWKLTYLSCRGHAGTNRTDALDNARTETKEAKEAG